MVGSRAAGLASTWHRLREREQEKRFQGLGAWEPSCITENSQRLGEDRKAIKKTTGLLCLIKSCQCSAGAASGREEIPHVQGQERWWWGDTPRPRSGMVVVRRYPTSKVRNGGGEEVHHVQGREWWWWGNTPRPRSGTVVVRRYTTSKVRNGGGEEIHHIQGKRNPTKTVGTETGHQSVEGLKPQSQKTSQSTHGPQPCLTQWN